MATVVAVDTGGTFTDLIMCQDGEVRTAKVLSTPQNPAEAILGGVEQLAGGTGSVLDRLLHGTTVATNAVLERKGARTAFVTNARFQDLMSIGRQARPELYALRIERPAPLAERRDCHGIAGRLDQEGNPIEGLDPQQLHPLGSRLVADGVESVSVCLLHSYANPHHELEVAQLLADVLEGQPISLSTEILPLFREYERATATTLNAYVQPLLRHYLTKLEEGVGCDLLIMQSDGGMASASDASKRPVNTLLSGPAGGVVGAARAGSDSGFGRVISFDMGGTSTDVSLIEHTPTLTREGSIGGLPLPMPALDINTVGAGGGSLAWLDAAGALKVGPQSAGASPGPACYGLGDAPTVTDAHVVLGRLPSSTRLGGHLVLDRERACNAVAELGSRAGLSLEATAKGIIRIANAHMVRAIKVISLGRGHDPREFALVTFGGAGGLHACEMADELGIETVLVPNWPGLLSAVGILGADLSQEFSVSLLGLSGVPDRSVLSELAAPLFERGCQFLDRHDVPSQQRRFEYLVEMRYEGQSFELAVACDSDFARIEDSFHSQHEQRYGYLLSDKPIQMVAMRVRALGEVGLHPNPKREVGEAKSIESEVGPILERDTLPAGYRVRGPAVVSELSGTTYLPLGWRLEVADNGCLNLSRDGS